MGFLSRFRFSRPLLYLSLSVALLPGCSGPRATETAAGDTLYIGVAATRTALTEAYFNGVRLAVAELNASRGSESRPFGLRLPPEEQPAQVEVAAAFRDDPSIIAVVGHTGSGQTLEAAPVYGDVERGGERAVVAITPTATNPAVTRASPWVFRVCPTDEDAARALARYAADSLEASRAAIIYRNDLFGRGYSRVFQETFESAGGQVLERDPYLTEITEFEAYAGRIARRAADVLVIAGGANDVADIMTALRATGAEPSVLGSDDLAGLTTDPELARAYAGIRYTAFFLADRPANPAAVEFTRSYRARFGTDPDHRAALSYDAAMLIGRAVAEAGPERRAIREWLARVGPDVEPYEGVTGTIRFNPWGDPVEKPVWVTELAP